MFTQAASYYDLIYASKDYAAEAEKLDAIIRDNLRSGGRRLLDVACGTGVHIQHLKARYTCEGLDIDERLLEIARERNPNVRFHRADMTQFDLDRDYDILTCLFSAIGYAKTLERLGRAIGCMARHLAPGGLLIIEPWFTPVAWHPNTTHASFVDEPELKIARVTTSKVAGRLSYFDFHYLIGTPEGTEHLVERHELGLFEASEMRDAFCAAGLDVKHDPVGLTGRGLYIGVRPG